MSAARHCRSISTFTFSASTRRGAATEPTVQGASSRTAMPVLILNWREAALCIPAVQMYVSTKWAVRGKMFYLRDQHR